MNIKCLACGEEMVKIHKIFKNGNVISECKNCGLSSKPITENIKQPEIYVKKEYK